MTTSRSGDERNVPKPDSYYDRMAELKREYDPDNVFRRNQNVAPAPTR